jgi:uncharacterized delta-60 repeat protein
MNCRRQLILYSAFFVLPGLLWAQADTAWVRRYRGIGNGHDYARAIAVDALGNVHVTGSSYQFETVSSDYATVKYGPDGETLWVRTYSYGTHQPDDARALALDDSGNVYVTGSSYNAGSYTNDYATIKYNAAGVQQWVARYSRSSTTEDLAVALALDRSDNVCVTGTSYAGASTMTDWVTVKYLGSSLLPGGETLWARRYNGPANADDSARAIAVDAAGNVYVTGSANQGATGLDFTTIQYSPGGVARWTRTYSGAGAYADHARALALDPAGNVCVTGSSSNGANYDYATIKYTPDGETLWVRTYDGAGSGNDEAQAIAVDGSGSVFVTGHSYGSGNSDYLTLKYSPPGGLLWAARYNAPYGTSADSACAIAVDSLGDVYVAGVSSSDYLTVKYKGSSSLPDGETLWTKRYSYCRGDTMDQARAIAVDLAGCVYVAGSSHAQINYDYATIKYVQNLTGISSEAGAFLAKDFELAASPNPFASRTFIGYSTRTKGEVSLAVYDAAGRLVRRLTQGFEQPGAHVATWDRTNASNRRVPAGIYFVRLRAGSGAATRALVVWGHHSE